jgi:hypothetical protein
VLTQALSELRDDAGGSGVSIPATIQAELARRKAEGSLGAQGQPPTRINRNPAGGRSR